MGKSQEKASHRKYKSLISKTCLTTHCERISNHVAASLACHCQRLGRLMELTGQELALSVMSMWGSQEGSWQYLSKSHLTYLYLRYPAKPTLEICHQVLVHRSAKMHNRDVIVWPLWPLASSPPPPLLPSPEHCPRPSLLPRSSSPVPPHSPQSEKVGSGQVQGRDGAFAL